MKIVAFNGNPRAEQSNTQVMLQAYLQGAQDAGARTERRYFSDRKRSTTALAVSRAGLKHRAPVSRTTTCPG